MNIFCGHLYLKDCLEEKQGNVDGKAHVKMLLGVFLTVLAGFLFTIVGFIIKHERLDFIDALIVRSVLQTLIYMLAAGIAFIPNEKGMTWKRRAFVPLQGIIGGVMILASFMCVLYMPFGDALTIMFTSPAVTAILSAIFLKHHLGLYKSAFICTLLTGTVLIIQPPFLFAKDETPSHVAENMSSTIHNEIKRLSTSEAKKSTSEKPKQQSAEEKQQQKPQQQKANLNLVAANAALAETEADQITPNPISLVSKDFKKVKSGNQVNIGVSKAMNSAEGASSIFLPNTAKPERAVKPETKDVAKADPFSQEEHKMDIDKQHGEATPNVMDPAKILGVVAGTLPRLDGKMAKSFGEQKVIVKTVKDSKPQNVGLVASKKTNDDKATDKKTTVDSDNETTDNEDSEKVADNEAPDKKVADKKVNDKKVTDKKVPDKKIADKKAADKKVNDKKVNDKKGADKKVADKKAIDKKSTGNKAPDKKSTDKKGKAVKKGNVAKKKSKKSGKATGKAAGKRK